MRMNQVKFRAWDNVEMKMYYTGEESDIHFYFDSEGIVAERHFDTEVSTPEGDKYISGDSEKLEHLKYLQYTGLKDENGVEIYEGDIVKILYCDKLLKIDYEEGSFGTYFQNGDCHELGDVYRGCEVVGNFYEHPHILEAKS